MRTIIAFSAGLSAILSTLTSSVMAQSPTILTAPTITPVGMPALFKAGCFSSQDPLIYRMQYTFDSSGSCQDVCYGESYNVLGLGNGTDCYCGNSLPAQASKVDDSQCNTPCVGFPNENCGSATAWTVWLTGFTHNQIGYFSPSSSSSSSVTSSTATSSSTSTAAATPKKSSPVGIVVGVIVAVVVVGALAGFAFFYFRRKQNAEMDEFKKNSDISSFVGSGSTAIDSNRPQMWAPDQRLDTNTAGNRISNGSIADNQDYSRKILQVRNPDGF